MFIPQTMEIPDLSGGAQRLDARFVQFDNVVLELLQYRDATQPSGGGAALATMSLRCVHAVATDTGG